MVSIMLPVYQSIKGLANGGATAHLSFRTLRPNMLVIGRSRQEQSKSRTRSCEKRVREAHGSA